MVIIKARPHHWTGYMYLLVYLFVVYLFKEKVGFTTETFPAPHVRSAEVGKAWLSASGLTGHAEVSAEGETSARLRSTSDRQPRALSPAPLPDCRKSSKFQLEAANHSCLFLHLLPWAQSSVWLAWGRLPAAHGESLGPWGDFPEVPPSQMGAKIHWSSLGRCQKGPWSSHFSQPCS